MINLQFSLDIISPFVKKKKFASLKFLESANIETET